MPYLPSASATISFWSTSAGAEVDALRTLGYQVRPGSTIALTEPGRNARLGWADSATAAAPVDAVWLARLTEEANSLACLQAAQDAVGGHGTILLTFENVLHPRLSTWRLSWISIAERLGLHLLHGSQSVVCLVRGGREPRWQLRLASEQDVPQIRALFKQVFGLEMSEAMWAWKYADGRGNAVLAYQDGQLVAHYGGVYREIVVDQSPDWALQGVDVMVHPDHRAVMTKRGAFFLVAATWLEVFVPLLFGFPSRRAMQLGQRLGIYAEANRISELRWKPSTHFPKLTSSLCSVDLDNSQHAANCDRLWDAMLQDHPNEVIGVRNTRWLKHRYVNHPMWRYEIVAVTQRLSRRWLGVVVFRQGEGRIELLDLIGEARYFAVLIGQLRRICALRGCSEIYGWATDAGSKCLAVDGATTHDTDISVPTECWTGSERSPSLIGRWWLSVGDTDFR